jgi:hypothetical protein
MDAALGTIIFFALIGFAVISDVIWNRWWKRRDR